MPGRRAGRWKRWSRVEEEEGADGVVAKSDRLRRKSSSLMHSASNASGDVAAAESIQRSNPQFWGIFGGDDIQQRERHRLPPSHPLAVGLPEELYELREDLISLGPVQDQRRCAKSSRYSPPIS